MVASGIWRKKCYLYGGWLNIITYVIEKIRHNRKETPYLSPHSIGGSHMRQIFMDVVNGPPTLGTLKFLTGPLAGSSYQITKPSISLGRDTSNDIVVSDPSVSRQHAQITWNNGAWSIQKLAKQNTLSVNQQDTQQSSLKDRDTIILGTGTTFIFQANVQQSPTPPFPTPQSSVQPPQTVPSTPPQPSIHRGPLRHLHL